MTIIISDEAVNIALNTWLGGVPAWRNDATERLRAEMRAALTAAAPHLAAVRVPDVDALAQEIRRVDGNHDKGAAALAEALMPFISALEPSAGRAAVLEEGYRQGIEAAAQIIETKQEGFQVRGGGRVLIDRSEGDQSGLGYAATIRALASHPVADKPDEAGAQGEGWLPIESALKDGAVIDLWCEPHDAFEVGNACRWPGARFDGARWRTRYVENIEDCWKPTHWRPLPAPPGGEVA